MTTPLTPAEWLDRLAALSWSVPMREVAHGWVRVVPIATAREIVHQLDRERRERVDPDLLARIEALPTVHTRADGGCVSRTEVLAILATEAPRDPNMDYERRDAMLDVVRRAYPATPDHTVVGEERAAGEGEQRAALAEAIHRVKPEIVNGATVTGSRVFAVLRGNGWRLTRATPRPR